VYPDAFDRQDWQQRADSMTPLGTKGVGELAIVGMAAAIANAVYHATGTRIRSLPISIEKVLYGNHGDSQQHHRSNSVPARED
jgi:xanthine dehydrogenase YagR molybdenum-binding subunit